MYRLLNIQQLHYPESYDQRFTSVHLLYLLRDMISSLFHGDLHQLVSEQIKLTLS